MNKYCILTLINLLLLVELPLFPYKKLDAILYKIAQALNNVIDQNYEENDRIHINNIEHLREELLLNEKESVGKTSIALSAKNNSIPGFPWGEILFSLVKIFQPQVVLELGTCIGISGSYFLAGLESNNKGKLFTVETLEPLLPFIEKNFKALGYQRYSILLGNIQKALKRNLSFLHSIDVVFEDHIHQGAVILRNFDQIYPYLASGALYIFDDIFINDDMANAWATIIQDQRVNISISLAMGLAYPHRPYRGCIPRIGIAVIFKENTTIKKHFDIKIENLNSKKKIIIKYGKLVVTK